MKSRWFWQILFWGFLLWFFGYILGILLFMVVPLQMIGWIILPLGTAATVWVVVNKFRKVELREYGLVGLVWMVEAIGFDYIFLVQLLKPEDGYYKVDVWLYYALTLLLPIGVGRLVRKCGVVDGKIDA